MVERKDILVSHGRLSEGIADAASMIVGKVESLSWLGLRSGQDSSSIADVIEKEALAHNDTQYLVIADVFGGSVCNACIRLCGLDNVRLVSGLNLGLVLELATTSGKLTDEQIDHMIESSRSGIKRIDTSEFGAEGGGEDDFF